ncbi:isochorismate synthase MenF [uncultured Pseudokineococcus sp.]|uniref:isochorismate synthase n=1 Tax=uncultured Pseudokineococcus sp. TaxID=1642928 RepID=UPI00262F2624|nr:isochorismate synthase [uncultured Pseudokineococcus sp.]
MAAAGSGTTRARRGAPPVAPPREGGERTPAPADLLAALRPHEDVLWSSARGTALARGTAERLDLPWTVDLPGAVADRLRAVAASRAGEAVVVGALPFRTGEPAALVRPERLLRAPGRLGPAAARGAAPVVVAEEPSPAEDVYRDSVRTALDLLGAGDLEKVVLARALDVTAREDVDVRALVAALARPDDDARVFSVPLATDAGGATSTAPGVVGRPPVLVGASPELLVSLTAGRVLATPLAGSTTRAADLEEDAARARALLASDKDRREHALVVEAMVRALRPWCADLVVPEAPELVATPTVWHLATRLEGRTADPSTTSLHLARALHPTPAVGGTPSGPARAAIDRLEPVDRGFYAGAVGWTDASGDGEWAVTIRCGVVQGRSVRLHAGAGIVRGSDPDAELAETTAKLALLRSALGA